MNSVKTFLAAGVLTSGLVIGCQSNEYNPPMQPTNLAAYAASVHYPTTPPVDKLSEITVVVNPMTRQLTIRNFGQRPLQNFDLWVNGSYVLHVDRIDPGASRVINTADVYNAAGNSLERVEPSGITLVQVQTSDGKLYNVQGPQQVGQ